MFTKFNLSIDEQDKTFFSNYIDEGKMVLSNKKAEYSIDMLDYLENGIFDGTKMEEEWFPNVKPDIFISHSHKDEDLAFGIAGWLKQEFGLECFIDSNIWGNFEELLEKLNDKYSDKEKNDRGGFTYNHKKANTASKNVVLMLMMALQKVIDKSESIIFLNTDNSILPYSKIYEDETYSSWIYSELVCAGLVQTTLPQRHLKIEYSNMNEAVEIDDIIFKYKVSLDGFRELTIDDLTNWLESCKNNNKYPLDVLYDYFKINYNEISTLTEYIG